MKILIIGGTGTISRGIADAAVQAKHEVTLLNRGKTPFRNPENCKIVIGDISKLHVLDKKLGKHVYDIIVDPLTYSLRQLLSRINFYKKHCKTYVFISSAAAIGPGESEKELLNEDTIKHPKWKYGQDKLACEEYLKTNPYNLNFIIIRPAVTYGDIRIPIPIACRENPYTVIDRILHNKPLVCFKLSDEAAYRRKLMQISDFGKYTVALFDKSVAINNDYIICSERDYSWNEAYDYLYKKLGKQKCLYEIDRSYFQIINQSLYDDIIYDKDAKNVLYSKDKCKRDSQLGLEETYLEQGISSLVDYLEENYKKRPYEDEYNLMSDYLLLHYANRDERLQKYLNTLSEDYKKTLERYYREKVLRNRINNSFCYKGIVFIKKLIRKIIDI